MILHKFIALATTKLDKVFVLSPCVRLEKEIGTKRHLLEFSQLDIEFSEKDKKEVMAFFEELVVFAIKRIKETCKKELKLLDRTLIVPKRPFAVFESKELKKRHGEDFEKMSSEQMREPFWILDHYREFYDREDDDKPGYFHSFDLIWPEGFGEALSGAERDFEYEKILRKMDERGTSREKYRYYLELARLRILKPTAGGGIGIERFVRFLAGCEDIAEVSIFSKKPGEEVIF